MKRKQWGIFNPWATLGNILAIYLALIFVFLCYGAQPPTTPGADLMSFAGWLAAGDIGIMCMEKIALLLRSGGLPPAGNDYNTCVMSFFVKGEKEPIQFLF